MQSVLKPKSQHVTSSSSLISHMNWGVSSQSISVNENFFPIRVLSDVRDFRAEKHLLLLVFLYGNNILRNIIETFGAYCFSYLYLTLVEILVEARSEFLKGFL